MGLARRLASRTRGSSPRSRCRSVGYDQVLVVQNFERVAVEDGDDGGGEVGCKGENL